MTPRIDLKNIIQRCFTLLLFTLLLPTILKGSVYSKTCTPKIAIVGAGIGGASTSHFLTELFNNSLEIDIYEGKKIGGRLATVKIDDEEYEAGGSVIHPKNKYMQYFAKLLGMEHRSTSNKLHGIWDGTEFVFIESEWKIMTLAKLIQRYGLEPFKLHSYVSTVLDDFENIYRLQDAGISFKNVTSLLNATNIEFPKLLHTSIKDNLLNMGYSATLIDELVKATLVVNYGQDVDVHSFVGSVSLAGAGTGLWSIKGGNKEVPEHLIYRNNKVNVIPSYVKKIRYISTNDHLQQYEVYYTNEDSTDMMQNIYDIVIIATPLTNDQSTTITFEEFPNDNMNISGEYHTTVATFVKGDLNKDYFELDETLDGILSCNPNKTVINSVGRIDSVQGAGSDSRIWKIFSKESLQPKFIQHMFLQIDKTEEVIWKAYPQYSTKMRFDKFELHDALYYVNAVEWAASAMEMSSIAGRNVAILAYTNFVEKCSLSKLPGTTHRNEL